MAMTDTSMDDLLNYSRHEARDGGGDMDESHLQ